MELYSFVEREKMKRVLHLLASNKFSGAEHVASNIIVGLKDSYSMAYASPEGPIRKVLTDKGIDYLPLIGLNFGSIRSVIREFKPDLIHAHDYRASIYAALVARHVPVVSHLHCNWPWARKVNMKTISYAAAINHFAKVVLVSESIREEFFFKSMLKRHSEVVGNVVDTMKILTSSSTVEASDFLFVGRLVPEKNPLAFIQLIFELTETLPRIRAIMLGDGPLEEECRKRVYELGLQDNIGLYGFKSDPYQFMKSTKVMVIPSRFEGFGLVALEALVLGVPVLCTPVGGLADIVRNGVDGFLCPTASFKEMALSLMENPELHSKLSVNATKRGRKLSDFESFCYHIDRIYSDILRRNPIEL
jgi:glycosyltransferase involved in cell wall biosynthesis